MASNYYCHNGPFETYDNNDNIFESERTRREKSALSRSSGHVKKVKLRVFRHEFLKAKAPNATLGCQNNFQDYFGSYFRFPQDKQRYFFFKINMKSFAKVQQ